MPPISPARASRYLVRADDPRHLAEFISNADEDPSITLLSTIGPPDLPHTAVVEMSPEKADSLEQQRRSGSSQLKIEPDQPLSPLDEGPGGQVNIGRNRNG
ncbi:MAG: hypothetical protein JWQ23_3223 [Herminiimonas sp.]|nr:hypothetical protein [Herminiimonas sp.]